MTKKKKKIANILFFSGKMNIGTYLLNITRVSWNFKYCLQLVVGIGSDGWKEFEQEINVVGAWTPRMCKSSETPYYGHEIRRIFYIVGSTYRLK